MGFKRVALLVVISFVVSLASYFAFNRFILRTGTGSAALAVNSPAESLTVTLDGEVLGKTAYYADTLAEGEFPLILSNGESSYQTKVKLTDGAVTVVNYSLGPAEEFSEGEIIWLEKSKESASLVVISDPDEAEVYLDDELLGQSPLSSKKVSVGEHTVKVSQEGYRSRVIKVQGQSGYKLNIKVRLLLLPVTAGVGRLEFPDESRFEVYDFSSNNPALYSDSSTWAKGIVFYSSRLSEEASPSAGRSYSLFLDYKGQSFDKNGAKTLSPEIDPADSVKVAYLGRKSDEGLTDDAREALKRLAEKVLPKEDKVQILPTGTGWLRVRQEPSLAAEEIGRVNEGDQLPLIAEEGTFYKVKLPDGQVGYISKNFSRKL